MNTLDQILQERLVLSENKIHVYLIQFDLFNSKDCIQYLSEDERVRAEKLKIPEKKDQFVITRCVLRLLLSSSTGKAHQDIEFLYGEHGKPSIQESLNDKSIEFNISHSGKYALIAITIENKIGVDIEKTNSNIDYISLAKRFFSDNEQAQLLSLDKGQQCDTFYLIWARKESFIKATGKGIAFGLDRFSVLIEDLNNDGLEIITSVAMDNSWFCYNLINIDNYKTALTTSKKNNDIVICY